MKNYKFWPTEDLLQELPYSYGKDRKEIRRLLAERGVPTSAGDRYKPLPLSAAELSAKEERMKEKIGNRALCFSGTTNSWRECAVQGTTRVASMDRIYFRLIDLSNGDNYLRSEDSPFLKVYDVKAQYVVKNDIEVTEAEFNATADELSDLAGLKCSYGSEGGGRVIRAAIRANLGAAVLIQTVRGRKWVSIADERLRIDGASCTGDRASCTDNSASCTDDSASCTNKPVEERMAAGSDVFSRMVMLSAAIKKEESKIEESNNLIKKMQDEYNQLCSLYKELQGKR